MDNREYQQEEVHDISVTDDLTGLYLESYALEKLEQLLKQSVVEKSALFIVDIDNYSVIKANFGEEYGNDILKTVAKNIRMVFRADDIIARAEEGRFVVLMINCADENTVIRKADFMCRGVKNMYLDEGNNLSASVGMVIADGTDLNAKSLWAKAENALEDVKNSDKCGYKLYIDNENKNEKKTVYVRGTMPSTFSEDKMGMVEAGEVSRRIMDRIKEQVTTTDTLTGMYLYDMFLKKLKEDIKNSDSRIIVIYADIKNFRYVNDNFGYTVGDKLLKLFCDLAKKTLKGYMYASRMYSDNVVVAYKMDMQKSDERNIQDIKEAIEEASDIIQSKFLNRKVTICAGIYIVEDNIDNSEIAVSNANLARKKAKRSEKCVVEIFESAMKDDYNYKMNLASNLSSALENEEIKVYYQPKVESGTGKVVGGEALVRWQKSDGSFIYPNQFIPFFEETGLILEVDYYVYEAVFANIKKRLEEGLPVVPISMNISGVHLESDNLIYFIRSLFNKYEIPAMYVEFEITESVYIENYDRAVALVEALKQMGSKISMDDFGSGYSSLNMLNSLPIDILKIDKVFLGKYDYLTENQKVIIKTVVDMATKLHLRTVCEGVESKEQNEFLTSVGCDMIQGFYYHRPVPMADFYEYLQNHEKIDYRVIRFPFDGDLKSDDGEYEGYYIGSELKFTKGPFVGTKAVKFPGGDINSEIVSIPSAVFTSNSYTITFWAKVEKVNMWTSIVYAEFEGGFNSVMPYGGDLRSDFRIYDNDLIPPYYDTGSTVSIDDKWHFYAATFNAITETATFFMDDSVAGVKMEIPVLSGIRRVYVGGDIFQESLKGAVAEYRVYNQALSKTDVYDVYMKDVSRMSDSN